MGKCCGLCFSHKLVLIFHPTSDDDSDDSDDEMPQLEGADTGPAPGVMTDEQMSKAKQTRYYHQIMLVTDDRFVSSSNASHIS